MGSGRKPLHIELAQHGAREKLVNKCWGFLNSCMDDPKVSKHQKIEIAKAICVKSMPTNLEMGEKTLEMFQNMSISELQARELEFRNRIADPALNRS